MITSTELVTSLGADSQIRCNKCDCVTFEVGVKKDTTDAGEHSIRVLQCVLCGAQQPDSAPRTAMFRDATVTVAKVAQPIINDAIRDGMLYGLASGFVVGLVLGGAAVWLIWQHL